MKPFNLEEYLKNPSRKVITRGGKNVRIICTDFNNPNFPVICGVEGSKWPSSFTTSGLLMKGAEHPSDLFFAPEKHEGWINIYSDTIVSRIYPSEEEAKENACDGAIATIKIEWEE